jgi:trehalose 6-phosphate phosphatase
MQDLDASKQKGGGVSRAPVPVPAPASGVCVFLDVDGTLLEFAAAPDAVSVDRQLVSLVDAARRATDGAIALVSGRPISELDRLFEPLKLPAAGVHGHERRSANGSFFRQASLDEGLPAARALLRAFVDAHPGLLLEDKRAALAVHYRGAPKLAGLVELTVAKIATSLLPEYEVQEGEAVFEIKPAAHNKATAIEAFMAEEPFKGRVPVFIGDDLTDYDGFAAVRRHQGLAIAVGDRVSAEWRLTDPLAVRRWLAAFVAQGEPAA